MSAEDNAEQVIRINSFPGPDGEAGGAGAAWSPGPGIMLAHSRGQKAQRAPCPHHHWPFTPSGSHGAGWVPTCQLLLKVLHEEG